jgi:hypothetical protein
MNARGRNPTARCRQAGKATSRGIEQSGQMRGGDEGMRCYMQPRSSMQKCWREGEIAEEEVKKTGVAEWECGAREGDGRCDEREREERGGGAGTERAVRSRWEGGASA